MDQVIVLKCQSQYTKEDSLEFKVPAANDTLMRIWTPPHNREAEPRELKNAKSLPLACASKSQESTPYTP